jgi:hypothetical protein
MASFPDEEMTSFPGDGMALLPNDEMASVVYSTTSVVQTIQRRMTELMNNALGRMWNEAVVA